MAGVELYGISDLHLSLGADKPMDIFGEHWRDHPTRIAAAWDAVVRPDDVVLCPGDTSWAMRLEEAGADLGWLAQRPGTIVLTRGNHDYWWNRKALSKVRAALPANCRALQHDAVRVGPWVVAGSRLWALPGTPEFGADDAKNFRHETQRLELSLQAGRALVNEGGGTLLAAVHYPPFAADGSPSAFVELLERYQVALCVYGHLHGAPSHRTAVEGVRNGVRYALVACDYIGFAPLHLTPLLATG